MKKFTALFLSIMFYIPVCAMTFEEAENTLKTYKKNPKTGVNFNIPSNPSAKMNIKTLDAALENEKYISFISAQVKKTLKGKDTIKKDDFIAQNNIFQNLDKNSREVLDGVSLMDEDGNTLDELELAVIYILADAKLAAAEDGQNYFVFDGVFETDQGSGLANVNDEIRKIRDIWLIKKILNSTDSDLVMAFINKTFPAEFNIDGNKTNAIGLVSKYVSLNRPESESFYGKTGISLLNLKKYRDGGSFDFELGALRRVSGGKLSSFEGYTPLYEGYTRDYYITMPTPLNPGTDGAIVYTLFDTTVYGSANKLEPDGAKSAPDAEGVWFRVGKYVNGQSNITITLFYGNKNTIQPQKAEITTGGKSKTIEFKAKKKPDPALYNFCQ